jgi:hypothetical protein
MKPGDKIPSSWVVSCSSVKIKFPTSLYREIKIHFSWMMKVKLEKAGVISVCI